MIKRILASILLAIITIAYSHISVLATPALQNAEIQNLEASYEKLVPQKLEEAMKNAISNIYGKEQTETIYKEIEQLIKKSKFILLLIFYSL